MDNKPKQKKALVEIPSGFYVSDGRPAKTIARLGIFDKPDKDLLEKNNIDAASFNFFVEWNKDFSDGTMMPEIWIKRIFSIEETTTIEINDIKNSDVIEKLIKLEGKDHIISLTNTMNAIGLKLRYLMVFNKRIDATDDSAFIGFFMDYSVDKDDFDFEFLSLKTIKEYILKYTGRKMNMGKILKVTETYLESCLYATGTPFPGDCDELLYGNGKIIALLEYKKCTGWDSVSVEEQSFRRYFPGADERKYTRINILRKYIEQKTKHELPLINIIYSVKSDDKKIKLEKIKPDFTLDSTLVFDVVETPKENKARLWEYVNKLI